MSQTDTAPGSLPLSREGALERTARATLFASLRGLRYGALEIRTPAGGVHRFEGDRPGPSATIHVHDARFFRRMLLDGELGVGESYIRGEWSSDSVMNAVRLGILNRKYLKRGTPLFWLGAIGAWLAHQTRTNTQPRARENIQAHYDLGNDFFELFLDPSMTYSCAYFEDAFLAADSVEGRSEPLSAELETLRSAQRAKYRLLAAKAELAPGQHVLEIGCGWGGFAEVAAREFGCRVTGITISDEQAAYARKRIAAAGLEDRVSIELTDYRRIEGRFDRIVSIEMLEAVGHRFLPVFFRTCDELLAPCGKAVVQVITIPDNRYFRYRLRPDYIQKFIFPGAHLPSLRAMKRAMKRTSLRITDLENLAPHYGPTLAVWRRRLLARREAASAQGFDEAFLRRWEFYFAYCEAAFRTDYVDDLHLVLERGERSKT